MRATLEYIQYATSAAAAAQGAAIQMAAGHAQSHTHGSSDAVTAPRTVGDPAMRATHMNTPNCSR